jgi:hypothetical protein
MSTKAMANPVMFSQRIAKYTGLDPEKYVWTYEYPNIVLYQR